MLCDYYPVLYYLHITNHTINVTYPDISVSDIPQDMDYSVYARSQSESALQYNTGFVWPSAYTEWSL